MKKRMVSSAYRKYMAYSLGRVVDIRKIYFMYQYDI